MPNPGEYGVEVGAVGFSDYYLAIVRALGCSKRDIPSKVSGGSIPVFAFDIDLPGKDNRQKRVVVPVFAESPMQHLKEYNLPMIVIVRGDPDFDYTGINHLDIVYRKMVSPNEFEVMRRGIVGRIDFEIQMYAYSKIEAGEILRYVMSRIKPYYGYLTVVDSKGKQRRFIYNATSLTSTTDIAGIPERYVSYSYSISFIGEFDVYDTVQMERDIISSPVVNFEVK